mmetsp:Transcript_15326/g.35519  ORF Transcript_15326/g.35519 Transcript_15326/m.35519 type:complete len:748 (+) Transcript_15326:179-2422(+)
MLVSSSPLRFQRLSAVSSCFVHEIIHSRNLWKSFDRFKSSTSPISEEDFLEENTISCKLSRSKIHRVKKLRNVGILAHVDAGKTTVTERMLELAGIVRNAGCVDDGNTVTDYLPAERERGITIQSAAIAFEWGWHNSPKRRTSQDDAGNNESKQNDNVSIQIIDTPGHVDFSVEVNRSVAVLDGAVLVVDAVAGVQAQTETVWRAMTRPSLNNHTIQDHPASGNNQYNENDKLNHEPLPCLALVNKMDKDGCDFGRAIQSLREKLPGANPIPTQIPLFTSRNSTSTSADTISLGMNDRLPSHIEAVSINDPSIYTTIGEFIGIVDLINMRAIVWPETSNEGNIMNVENCTPKVLHLMKPDASGPTQKDCKITKQAIDARSAVVEALAEVDTITEEQYLNDQEPSNDDLRAALRRATLAQKAVPVMAAAALKGKGLEPLLDGIADFLPSPLDRNPPALQQIDKHGQNEMLTNANACAKTLARGMNSARKMPDLNRGHPLHRSSLALAFKVVHMKGRGSGDGRVVFARIYSGKFRDREQLKVITPPAPGEVAAKVRVERIGGMLELAGGRFGKVEGGEVESGEVCALVGLKTVVTGDTLILASDTLSNQNQRKALKESGNDLFYLAGVASPKPVLTVRLESETSQEEARLSDALKLMSTEDPSLLFEETDSGTLLSGLGELHIEVALDRIHREYGLQVMVGPPFVAYRETVKKRNRNSRWFDRVRSYDWSDTITGRCSSCNETESPLLK